MTLTVLMHDFSGHPFQKELAFGLAKRGYRVTYSCCSDYPSGKARINYRDEGAFFDDAPLSLKRKFPKYNLIKRLIYETSFTRLLIQQYFTCKPDTVILSNTPLITAWFFLLISRCKSVIYWHQDLYSKGISGELQNRFGKFAMPLVWFFTQIERAILIKAIFIVPISHSFLDTYEAWNIDSDKIGVLENWAPIGDLKRLPKSNAWTVKNGLNESKFRILYAGTLGRKHRPEIMISLMHQLINLGMEAELLVISEGDGVSFMKELTFPTTAVKFFDFQPWEVMSEVISSSDICLVLLEPEASEYSIPSKVATYLACGAIIVGFVPKENRVSTIIDEVGGFRVEPDDSNIMQAANWILNLGKQESDMIRSSSIAYATNHFGIEGKVDYFEKIMERTICTSLKS